MGDFLRLILDSIKYLWPFRVVMEWEEAGLYIWGRYRRKLRAGIYPIVPFFMEVREFPVVPAIVMTPRQNITLKDGTTLHFRASMWARVADLNLAINTVDNYTESTQELMMSVLSDKLAEVDADRLRPEGRRRLLTDLEKWVAVKAAVFGIEATDLAFTDFVHKPRTYLLLSSVYGAGEASW